MRTISEAHVEAGRRPILDRLVLCLEAEIAVKGLVDVTVICTHNSRRSQLAQCWLNALAERYNIPIRAWSGGTEATQFHPNMVYALREVGFQLTRESDASNPMYSIGGGTEEHHTYFSKIYDSDPNPKDGFVALVVCSSANESCPIVHGSNAQVYLPYQDPKLSDGTGAEQEVYLQRAMEVGKEMEYVCVRLKEKLQTGKKNEVDRN